MAWFAVLSSLPPSLLAFVQAMLCARFFFGKSKVEFVRNRNYFIETDKKVKRRSTEDIQQCCFRIKATCCNKNKYFNL